MEELPYGGHHGGVHPLAPLHPGEHGQQAARLPSSKEHSAKLTDPGKYRMSMAYEEPHLATTSVSWAAAGSSSDTGIQYGALAPQLENIPR